MKPRVLACAYACQPEGSFEWVGPGELILGWNVVKQLARFHQVWVLTHSQHRLVIEDSLRRDPVPNLEFYYVDLPGWLRPVLRFRIGTIQLYGYLWQVKAYFVARRLHQRFRFHVFHHLTFANDWMASFIGALLPVPFIRGPGGGAHCTPQAFLREYSFRGRFWEQLRVAGQWLLRHDPFFILGHRRARAILVCNREAFEALPPKWQEKAQFFPVNGVSTDDLAMGVTCRRSGSTFRVLSAGKLLRIKAFALSIRAFKAFAEKCPHAELIIVGDGPERPRLGDLVHRLGLQTQVSFEEWMPREKLLQKMHSCDVFLFPSLRDGGGAVVVEAMAAGKPVVCLDLAGPGMHVTDECGIKIPPESPEQVVREMAAALERLYNDKGLRCRMGKAARARAEQVYHWDRLGERLNQIYQQALRVPPTHDKLRSSQ